MVEEMNESELAAMTRPALSDAEVVELGALRKKCLKKDGEPVDFKTEDE